MICKHERIRCTNGVFYCLICGKELPKKPKQEEPKEEPKPKKRGAKK